MRERPPIRQADHAGLNPYPPALARQPEHVVSELIFKGKDFVYNHHLAVQGWPLLTRDVRRYRNYFPTVQLIAPE